jgi:GNAT superfamily N-acetyltransferase
LLARPGHHWKTPFVWEAGCPEPAPSGRLRFRAVDESWLREALVAILSSSLSEADQHLVGTSGPEAAVGTLMSLAAEHFIRPPAGWREAWTLEGERIGFVLPVLFREPEADPQGRHRPEGTIFHMGVLPGHRGRGHALDLVHEATRVCREANCWRIFCDTSSRNAPMLQAFRQAGYRELEPWQRPIA